MDTQGSHTGTLKRIDVDKTPSDLAVLGPLGQRPHTEYEISFIFCFLVGIRTSARGQYSGQFVLVLGLSSLEIISVLNYLEKKGHPTFCLRN